MIAVAVYVACFLILCLLLSRWVLNVEEALRALQEQQERTIALLTEEEG